MSSPVKIALYLVLAIAASASGFFALASFGQLMNRSEERMSALEQIEPERKTPVETVETTNEPALEPADTNAAAAIQTNISAEPTPAQAVSPSNAAPQKGKGGGRLGLWSGVFVMSIIGLGLLIANDVSHFLGNRALKTLYNEDGDGIKNPEYEQAEEVWANGNHLEAISLMREYLNKNPREQHVAIRIAEIYEKDLNNHLAAALEYEEVLKHKLHPERWGWAAIHLCNLYFKLNQEQKAYPLLRRIVNEYPETPAADKARKRLEQVEGATGGQMVTEEQVNSTPAPSDTPVSGLPPGFRPKK